MSNGFSVNLLETLPALLTVSGIGQRSYFRSAPRVCYTSTARSRRSKLGEIKMRALVFAAFGAILSCTSSLAQSSPEKISSTRYNNLTCLQIAQEGRSISKKGFILAGMQAGTGGSDGSATKSAVVIVWPTVATNGKQLADADREMNALEQASVGGQCSIQFQRPPKG
jgi:hypothetical protein